MQPREAARFAPPTINLPKGGGPIRGIGEKFTANSVTGTGSAWVPIATSPGRSGFGPQLSLTYDSGAGQRPFRLRLELVAAVDRPQNRSWAAEVRRRSRIRGLYPLRRRGPRARDCNSQPGDLAPAGAATHHKLISDR
jgi:hypothetical protein